MKYRVVNITIRSCAILALMLTIIACEKIIELDVKDDTRKITLNGIVTPGKNLTVSLTRSLHILDNSEFKDITNGTVLLYIGNTLYDTLHHIGFGEYSGSKLIPVSNEQFQIKATAQGFKEIEATDYLPAAPQIMSIDTATEMYAWRGDGMDLNSREPEEMLRISIKINDPANTGDYYFLSINSISAGTMFNNGQINFFTDDPSIDDKSYEPGKPFSDDLFNGKQHELKIYIYKPWQSYISVNLMTISKSYYMYFKSFIRYTQNHGDPFAEPVMVYSNINGGFGIFAGSISLSDTMFVAGSYTPKPFPNK